MGSAQREVGVEGVVCCGCGTRAGGSQACPLSLFVGISGFEVLVPSRRPPCSPPWCSWAGPVPIARPPASLVLVSRSAARCTSRRLFPRGPDRRARGATSPARVLRAGWWPMRRAHGPLFLHPFQPCGVMIPHGRLNCRMAGWRQLTHSCSRVKLSTAQNCGWQFPPTLHCNCLDHRYRRIAV